VFAGWRTGLPGPVIVLQAGTAVNYFGTGLILPFEIIYLHQARGFPTATAGLVLAAVMGTAAVVTPLSGALLDRFRAKPILITGNLASALLDRAPPGRRQLRSRQRRDSCRLHRRCRQ
jgi:MFS family permease